MKNWVTNFFTKEYISVSGVIPRAEFLKRILLTYIVMFFGLLSIEYLVKGNSYLSIIGLIIMYGCCWYIISLSIRRLHDAGFSGLWLFLIALIAKLNQSQLVTIHIKDYEIIVTIISIIILGSLSKKSKNNRFKN